MLPFLRQSLLLKIDSLFLPVKYVTCIKGISTPHAIVYQVFYIPSKALWNQQKGSSFLSYFRHMYLLRVNRDHFIAVFFFSLCSHLNSWLYHADIWIIYIVNNWNHNQTFNVLADNILSEFQSLHKTILFLLLPETEPWIYTCTKLNSTNLTLCLYLSLWSKKAACMYCTSPFNCLGLTLIIWMGACVSRTGSNKA